MSTVHLLAAVKSPNQIDLALVELICDGLVNSGVVLHEIEDCGISVLGYCCKNGKEDVVKYLLNKSNASIQEFINFGNPSPLWLGASNGHKRLVELLLERVEIIEYNKEAPDGTSPLMIAIAKEHFDIVDTFVEKKVVTLDVALQECAKFGKFDYINGKLKKINAKSENFNPVELMRNAVQSGCSKTIDSVVTFTELDLIRCFKNERPKIYSKPIRKLLSQPTSFKSSALVDMTRRFSSFNEDVEKKSDLHNYAILPAGYVKPLVLGDFCCIKMAKKSSKLYLRSIKNIDSFRCPQSCKIKQDCQVTMDLLSTGILLENELKKEDRSISHLGPSFILVGSVAEGTRLHRASELDITVEFEELKETPFTIADKATQIMAPHCMREFYASEESNLFDYPKFLLYFLTAVESALIRIKDKMPRNLKFSISENSIDSNRRSVPCDNCLRLRKDKSVYEPWTHCVKCLPAVTHTKLGPCLIFEWNDGSLDVPLVVTMDLVPNFPVKDKSVLELYNLVFKTLIEDRPPGWLDYFNNILKIDIILPESFSSQKNSTDGIANVAIKLLNYGPKENYIIKPAQEMEVQQDFQEVPMLKKVCCYMKAINALLSLGAKSYFMKKVLLLPDFIAKAKEPKSRLDELVYDAITQPDLQKLFKKRIDLETWRHDIKEASKNESGKFAAMRIKK